MRIIGTRDEGEATVGDGTRSAGIVDVGVAEPGLAMCACFVAFDPGMEITLVGRDGQESDGPLAGGSGGVEENVDEMVTIVGVPCPVVKSADIEP